VNNGEEDAKEEERGGGGEGRRLTCCGSWRCWRRWRWQDAAASDGGGAGNDGSHCFFPYFVSCFFLLLFFFFSFSSLGYLLSIPILLLSSFSLFLFSALLFFALSSPVFRGKNRGERGRGGHCAVVPPTRGKLWASRGSVGVFLKGSQRLFEGEGGGKQENKTFFFPCFLHVQGKNKGYSTVQNGIVLGSLFFFNSV
jgi:hypothetical protein